MNFPFNSDETLALPSSFFRTIVLCKFLFLSLRILFHLDCDSTFNGLLSQKNIHFLSSRASASSLRVHFTMIGLSDYYYSTLQHFFFVEIYSIQFRPPIFTTSSLTKEIFLQPCGPTLMDIYEYVRAKLGATTRLFCVYIFSTTSFRGYPFSFPLNEGY